ncbi:hypothetical protein K438DRAFT_1784754 [Mycena galopus ATCC 62051]|nr:hypothetical protein K438DRAFT_1784754 [Mycena galopus ATCC 62051]
MDSDYNSVPASPASNLDPSSLTAVDIPMADLNTNLSSSNNTNENTFICLGNVEGALLRLTGLVENLPNAAPHTALVPGVPPTPLPGGLQLVFSAEIPASSQLQLHMVPIQHNQLV